MGHRRGALAVAIWVILLSLAFGAFGPAAAQAVSSIRIGDNQATTRFVIEADGPLKYAVFTLADPYRIVIDVSDATFSGGYGADSGGIIERYRYGLFQPGTSRVVLDLKTPAIVAKHFTLPADGKIGYRMVVDLQPVSREVFLAAVRPPSDVASRVVAAEAAPQPEKPRPPAAKQTPASSQTRKVVVIDAGHGGVDPGTVGINGALEKDVTLMAAKTVKTVLEKTGRYQVVLTRDKDFFIPLRQRFQIARRAGADLFISLHADSFKTADVRGASVYTLSETSSDREAAALAAKENKSDVIAGIDLGGEAPEVSSILIDLARRETMNYSAHFANVLVRELGQAVPLRRNTHRFAGFMVLKAPDVPSVLLEMGYLSNAQDAAALTSRQNQEKLAAAILRAVDHYFLKVANHQTDLL